MPRVRLYGKKDLRTAAYNRSAANFFLELAETQVEGQFYSAQASIVFSAFTHEAFLNTLGPKIVKEWADHERDRPGDKLNLICKRIGYKPNRGRRPYQTLKRLFKFRNLIAHGREETIRVEGKIVPKQDKSGYLNAIEGEWEKYCTVNNARRAYDDVRAIAVDLCRNTGIQDFAGFPFGSPASGLFRVQDHDT
jgi:hypothetical protein